MSGTAAKNRSKIWKWAHLIMEHDHSLVPVPLASVGKDEPGVLLQRGTDPVLLLQARPEEIAVSCPTGEKPAWGLPVNGAELRTSDVLARLIATVGGVRPDDDQTVRHSLSRTFEVLGRWTRSSRRDVGTRAGEWVAGDTFLSPSGLARRSTGEFAAVNGAGLAEDDAHLLKDFAESGRHPRRLDVARIPNPVALPAAYDATNAFSLPDGSVVIGSSDLFRWRPGGAVERLPVSGAVIGCWSPPGGESWLLTKTQACSISSGRVVSPLPAGARFLAAGARVAWSVGDPSVSLTDLQLSSPEQIAMRSRVAPAAPTGESWSRFLFDDNGELLWFHGYMYNVVAALDTDATQWRSWDGSVLSGYGHVGGYGQRGGLVTIIKTHGVLVLDRASAKLWSLSPDYPFKHTRAAFAPSGTWILVLGDDVLYALTLCDHVLRRLSSVTDVLDVVPHPRGFILLGAREVTLLDATDLEGPIHDAPHHLRLESRDVPGIRYSG